MSKLSIEEKVIRVRDEMAKKRFSSIEEACRYHKLSPASYYNYAKKLTGTPTINGSSNAVPLPSIPTSAKEWTNDILALRKENEDLKKQLESDRARMIKLERKLISITLGESLL